MSPRQKKDLICSQCFPTSFTNRNLKEEVRMTLSLLFEHYWIMDGEPYLEIMNNLKMAGDEFSFKHTDVNCLKDSVC